jgi:hypothetical protein
MAFPATQNIQYYMGDTHEFRIYPKDAAGDAFPLAQYNSVRFTLAERRGTPLETDAPRVSCYAAFSNDRTNILCAITPENSAQLDASKTYVYDVEIYKSGSPYDSVFTLLTGTVSITDQVTPIQTLPGEVTNLVSPSQTSSSISISWSAPTSTVQNAPSSYDTYVIPYDVSYENVGTIAALESALSLATPFNTTDTSFTFTETTAVPALGILSGPLLPETAYIYAVVSRNQAGVSGLVGNYDPVAGTIDEQLTESAS